MNGFAVIWSLSQAAREFVCERASRCEKLSERYCIGEEWVGERVWARKWKKLGKKESKTETELNQYRNSQWYKKRCINENIQMRSFGMIEITWSICIVHSFVFFFRPTPPNELNRIKSSTCYLVWPHWLINQIYTSKMHFHGFEKGRHTLSFSFSYCTLVINSIHFRIEH